jgi:phenylalanyl-tRNA synthetase beta chain
MKISFNWLKDYLKFDLTPQETAVYLTSSGLEVDGIEEFESIKGSLKGLIVGEVLTCTDHPDSDHLHLTTVYVGNEEILHIVCGAPNIAAGQKVVVATIGTKLYDGDESFIIKKSKIRGAVSEGMICSAKEIGVGEAHDGILVLPAEVAPGTLAADYFKVEQDYIIEIGLTPNRNDAISHFGVARDLYATLSIREIPCSSLRYPCIEGFIPKIKNGKIDVTIKNIQDCYRYSGLLLANVNVKESPAWLKNRLLAVGVRPINNIVDITNYIMFELGQPLHAFDADYITGKKVIIQNLPEGTPFVTLDGNELKISKEDLMICNEKEGMCIAGVYGGLHSGVSEKTRTIFLESANFNPISVRKTSKRHHLNTESSFRFERGVDPELTVLALKRAATLIQELADADIVSEIIDEYPTEIKARKIRLSYDEVSKVIGKKIDKEIISNILLLLGMEVSAVGEDIIMVTVPLNRADVIRPIDLIEEILRIYGYENVEVSDQISYTLYTDRSLHSERQLQKQLSTYLVNNGFFEVMNNSLTKEIYAQKFDFIIENQIVKMLNPLSNELSHLRQTLLFSGLENIVHNCNNKNENLKIFEFGKIYFKTGEKEQALLSAYQELPRLGIFLSGKNNENQWNYISKDYDFYDLKNMVSNLLHIMKISDNQISYEFGKDEIFVQKQTWKIGDEVLAEAGQLQPSILKFFDLKKAVFFADVRLNVMYANAFTSKTKFSPINAFPAVKRDLALILDKAVAYEQLESIAYKYGSHLLQKVSLFDVYEGEKIENGKKSYALNLVLQHKNRTLTEEDINKVMNTLINAFEKEAGAKLR